MATLLWIAGVGVASLFVFSIYSTFAYAIEAARFPGRLLQWRAVVRSQPSDAPSEQPVPDWLNDRELDSQTVRKQYFAAALAACKALDCGEPVDAEMALQFSSLRERIDELHAKPGMLDPWKGDDWSNATGLKPVVDACLILACQSVQRHLDDDAIAWIESAFKATAVIGRGGLWISHLVSCGSEMAIATCISSVIRAKGDDRAFLLRLRDLIQPLNPISAFRSSVVAEMEHAQLHFDDPPPNWNRWNPQRRIETFVATHFASWLLGNRRVYIALCSHEMPNLLQVSQFPLFEDRAGLEQVSRLSEQCRQSFKGPFRLTKLEFPSMAASVLNAMIKQATTRSLLRTALAQLAKPEEEVVGERDWFGVGPVAMSASRDVLVLHSCGHGVDMLGHQLRHGAPKDLLEFRFSRSNLALGSGCAPVNS